MALEGNALELAVARVADAALNELKVQAKGNRADEATLADRAGQAVALYALKVRTEEQTFIASFVASKATDYEAHREAEITKIETSRAEVKAAQEEVAALNAKITPTAAK